MTKNALDSLFNGALTNKREQTVLTPDWILDAVRAVGPIRLDPCTTDENPVGALNFFTKADDGLALSWDMGTLPGVTFVNPPFDALKLWLAKARVEAHLHATPIYFLTPVRTHRPWFGAAMAEAAGVQYLKAFAFKGFKGTFPAPMCLLRWNAPRVNLPAGMVTYG